MNLCTLCRILVVFGPETPEFTLLTIASLCSDTAKSTYHAKYLKISWTYLDLLYRFARHISVDDYPNIRLAVTLLKSKLRSSNPFRNAYVTNEDRRQIAGESWQTLRVLTA